MTRTQLPERRDIQSVLADIRVDVGQIRVRQEEQGKTLATLSQKLDLGVFREEYERRQKQLESQVLAVEQEANSAREDMLRREGATRVWRIVFTSAVALLGLLQVVLHR